MSALCGNAWAESSVNPARSQIGGGAFGLYQWDGERRTNLEAWMKSNGYDIYDPNGQMQYLIVENEWINNFGEFSNLTEFLNSTSTDIHYLTECFCRNWERPGELALQKRFDFADKAYTYISQHYQDDVSWIIKIETELSEAEALNNSVLMYKFYSEDTPVPPTPPEPSEPIDLLKIIMCIILKKRGLTWI